MWEVERGQVEVVGGGGYLGLGEWKEGKWCKVCVEVGVVVWDGY